MHCQCNPRFCDHFPVKSELLEHLMFWPQSCDGRAERGDWSSNHPCTGTHLPIGNTNFIFSCETFSSGGAQVSLAVSSSLIGCPASNQPIRGERRQSLDDFPQPGSLHNPVSLTACKTRSADCCWMLQNLMFLLEKLGAVLRTEVVSCFYMGHHNLHPITACCTELHCFCHSHINTIPQKRTALCITVECSRQHFFPAR